MCHSQCKGSLKLKESEHSMASLYMHWESTGPIPPSDQLHKLKCTGYLQEYIFIIASTDSLTLSCSCGSVDRCFHHNNVYSTLKEVVIL